MYRCSQSDLLLSILAIMGPARAEDLNYNWNENRTQLISDERLHKYEKKDNAIKA